MGLDATEMVATIASGTTGYFAEFMPILVFVAGIVLAFGIMEWLISLFLDLQDYKYQRNMFENMGTDVSDTKYRDFKTWRKYRDDDTI